MTAPQLLRQMFLYGRWANDRLLTAAGPLPDAALDHPFEMGVGSLRRTLLHLFNGEFVWLQRWQGRRDAPWPDEHERATVATIAQRFADLYPQRDSFLTSVKDVDLSSPIVYRDSKGSLFAASLAEMLVQGFNHSTHHRAQAANMLRHVGVEGVELDYMYSVRRPAQG